MTPIFRLEDSDFGGIKDLTKTSTRNIWITLESVQKEMDGSNEQCNFDYKGTFNISRNNFGFLGTQVMIKIHFYDTNNKKSYVLKILLRT